MEECTIWPAILSNENESWFVMALCYSEHYDTLVASIRKHRVIYAHTYIVVRPRAKHNMTSFLLK